MKSFLIFLFFTLFSTICAFSQNTLFEFIVEKDDNPQVFYKGKGCTPEDGVLVFYTAIPYLEFSMPDTPNRLKNVSSFDQTNNCYVLCVQPTDTKIGGISQYTIAITAKDFKPMPAFMLSGIYAGVVQYFNVKLKEDWNSAIESIRREIVDIKGQVSGVTGTTIPENNASVQVVEKKSITPDVIILKNGEDIQVLVQEVSDIEVKYKKIENSNGPNYTLKKSEVIMIRYANGSRDMFLDNTPSSLATTSPTQASTFPVQNREIYNPDGIELVYVEGSGGIKGFYIGKYEVTQAQWKTIMGANPSYNKGDDLPVNKVNWDDIQMFLEKLNQHTGNDYRLPTEDEWEFAARGGTASSSFPVSRNYSGNNNIDLVAWYNRNSGNRTHPIGTKQPNELGIYDMSGNVFELCVDQNGKKRALHGGAFNQTKHICRTSRRVIKNFTLRHRSVGFRVALTP